MEKLSEKLIALTPLAAQKVKEFMAKEANGAELYLRVYVSGGGCAGLTYGMALEEKPEEDDLVFEEQGVKLVVDPVSLGYLKGAEIDYVESLMGSGFRIENPNVRHTCACGHSFAA
ncbi:MAG: iron-sulfur cluster insertion protein ErpA [Nitrososphaerota archaeon]